MDIAEWLRGLGLEEYASAFAQNHIGPELLPTLRAEELKEIGVASFGHRVACSKRLPACPCCSG